MGQHRSHRVCLAVLVVVAGVLGMVATGEAQVFQYPHDVPPALPCTHLRLVDMTGDEEIRLTHRSDRPFLFHVRIQCSSATNVTGHVEVEIPPGARDTTFSGRVRLDLNKETPIIAVGSMPQGTPMVFGSGDKCVDTKNPKKFHACRLWFIVSDNGRDAQGGTPDIFGFVLKEGDTTVAYGIGPVSRRNRIRIETTP